MSVSVSNEALLRVALLIALQTRYPAPGFTKYTLGSSSRNVYAIIIPLEGYYTGAYDMVQRRHWYLL